LAVANIYRQWRQRVDDVGIPCKVSQMYGPGNLTAQLFRIDASLWPPCVADADIIFYHVVCSIFSFFLSSPNLSRRRSDVCRTFTHGVALVRI